MKILLQNNFSYLLNFNLSQDEVLFAPIYYSALQRRFFEKRFEQIKRVAAHVAWVEAVDFDDFDVALALDASYERRAFAQKLSPVQNRLFQILPFAPQKSFTPFRDLAEKKLPHRFSEANAPFDQEVLNELDYYFRNKKLPLTYLETRNELVGRDGSTKFSAFLSCGALDVRHLYNEIRNFEDLHGATKSTSWLVYELLWREFFYWHYQDNPQAYFSKNGIKGQLDFSGVPEMELSDLRKLCSLPFFNAALTELVETGFLSNRARQIFASIWINDLGLDWRAGAQLFEEHLIDYDVYSNYGNWMYLAGVGVDPRGKRYFNVDKQLEMYDPKGTYLKAWL